MAFPTSPVNGDLFTAADGTQWEFQNGGWRSVAGSGGPSTGAPITATQGGPATDTFAVDADGFMLVSDGTNYQYAPGLILNNEYETSDLSQTLSSATPSVTRHNITITPKSSNSVIEILADCQFLENAAAATANNDVAVGGVFVDGVQVIGRIYESDPGGSVDIKSYGQCVLKIQIPSTGVPMLIENRAINITNNTSIQVTASSLSIQEIS